MRRRILFLAVDYYYGDLYTACCLTTIGVAMKQNFKAFFTLPLQRL